MEEMITKSKPGKQFIRLGRVCYKRDVAGSQSTCICLIYTGPVRVQVYKINSKPAGVNTNEFDDYQMLPRYTFQKQGPTFSTKIF
jgi:hypothetical protein